MRRNRNATWLIGPITPGVIGATLDDRIASFEVDFASSSSAVRRVSFIHGKTRLRVGKTRLRLVSDDIEVACRALADARSIALADARSIRS